MKKYFSTEDREEVKTVKVVAQKRGNVVTREGIFHMDPDGADPISRARTVPINVARELIAKGIAKYENGGSRRTDGNAAPGDRLGAVIANRRATSIENDGEQTRYTQTLGISGASTRDTTAFPTDPVKRIRIDPDTTESTVGDDEDELATSDEDDDGVDGSGGSDDGESDPTQQEGGASGGDTPPLADAAGGDTPPRGDDMSGSSETEDDHGSDDDGSSSDSAGDDDDSSSGEASSAASPKPRRGRRAATTSTD